jgi:hypothetical protein
MKKYSVNRNLTNFSVISEIPPGHFRIAVIKLLPVYLEPKTAL